MIIFVDACMIRLREQATWHGELLHLRPVLVRLFRALQGDYMRVFRSRVVEPFQRVAHVLTMTVTCALLAAELFEGLEI